MLKIEPFTPSDFDRLISWVDSEEFLVQFAGPIFQYPLTKDQLVKYIEQDSRIIFKVVDLVSSTTIGHAEIALADSGNCRLCRILIGQKGLRGKGLGQELVKILLNRAFNELGAERAELNVYDWNHQAIKCYERVGFTLNPGEIRKLVVNGQTWTSLNMILLKSNWKT